MTETILIQCKKKLGKTWFAKAGDRFKYFMVFDKKSMDGGCTLADALKLVSEL